MQNNKNFVLFLVLSLGLMFGGIWVSNKLWPPPEKKKPDDAKVVKADKDKDKDKREKDKPPEVEPPKPRPRPIPIPAAAGKQITLGADSDNLKVVLTSRGAGVLRVWLNRFQQADALGLPEWLDGEGKRVPKPLELVMEELNRETPSHVLYHMDQHRKGHDPLPDLGYRLWDVTSSEEEGVVRRVEFTTVVEGVRITKVFTLQPGDYHIGLEVRLERARLTPLAFAASALGVLGSPHGQGALLAASALLPGKADDDDRSIPFRYQLTSAHGLRIEGEWYTSVLRNALIGWHDTKRDSFTRTLEEARRINFRSGGDPVEVTNGDKRIRWAGVAVQFFASMLVVDNEGQENQSFLSRARPTLEGAAVKGRIKSISEDRQRFVLLGQDNVEYAFRADDKLIWPINLREGTPVAVVFTTDEYDQRVALEFRPEDRTEPLFFNDIVVRVATEPLELKPGGEPIVHRYLLYNGPVKARLLGYLEGQEREVSPELVTRYEKTLHLNTITDYPSMAFTEQLDAYLYFTRLLVACTNLMHSVLWFLHTYVMPWSYGLCILLLTVLVRGMMFPISRKQAMTSMRMQELAPELKKLQEKHKGDKQALGVAQMQLYRKHGVNPLGTCWIIFLQMPIFLGLYYCLQESIMFRLAPFMWVRNLAAPDMLIWWGEQIPWISRPMDYGSFLYLGPFFNLLPVVAAALMIVQQSLMTPPAMDEQQAMQMKMMKYMMVIFGLMFYKVAAGLCVYFIASSLWGFAERKLLPKKKPAPGTAPEPESQGGLVKKLREGVDGLRGAVSPTPSSSQETNGPAGKKGKRRKGKGGSAPVPAAAPADGVSGKVRSWWGGLREWWAEVRRQAEKKG